ncbi:MAG: FRG domain-containing protein [Alphaproteobacteria bacterium]|nr:MAG: FRG domain-containing protein [Alphaproteobacteria bacterium]
MGLQTHRVNSLAKLIEIVKRDTAGWTNDGFAKPWFRGVSDAKYKLLPSIFRYGDLSQKEFDITKKFRLRAPGFGPTPHTDRIDQWLFLMQHHGVPTRLLDWSESLLVAVYFAVSRVKTAQGAKADAAIFAIDPTQLNLAAGMGSECNRANFPNTWAQNSALQTIKIAFGTASDRPIPVFHTPIAIYPSTIHARVGSQKSCFTLHGTLTSEIEAMFEGQPFLEAGYLRKYVLPKSRLAQFSDDLANCGVTHSSVFPDLDGLANELRHEFRFLD